MFLERGLADLQRNALVSVFLRVLEYNVGIHIPHLQPCRHFRRGVQIPNPAGPALRKPDRRSTEKDLAQLPCPTQKEALTPAVSSSTTLWTTSMSLSRRTRTAARSAMRSLRLASWRCTKEETFCYEHLNHVIEVSGVFEKYLKTLRQGLSDDQLTIGKWDSSETWGYQYEAMIISLHSLYPHNHLLKRYLITRVRGTTPLDTISSSHACPPTPNIPFKHSRITSSSSHMPSAITPAEAKSPNRARNRIPTPSPRPAKKRSAETQASMPTDRADLPPSIPKGFIPRHSVTYVHRPFGFVHDVCAPGAEGPAHERTNE